MGDFTNWECRTGSVSGNGGVNTVTWYGLGEVSDRHLLIAPNNTAVDEYGGFPQHCPNTNSYSVRLGNDNNGHEAEGIFYTFDIPANNTIPNSPFFIIMPLYCRIPDTCLMNNHASGQG
jgi:hypothetical protein